MQFKNSLTVIFIYEKRYLMRIKSNKLLYTYTNNSNPTVAILPCSKPMFYCMCV